MEQPVELLLVDDNPSDVELTVHVLKKNNFANRIKVVHDGAEAMDYIFGDLAEAPDLPRSIPKLILMDLKLPKVNGLELLARVKADPRTKLIPVVVLTSSREERDLLKCYELGVNSYIVKPVNYEKFVAAVRDLAMYWLLLNQPPKLES